MFARLIRGLLDSEDLNDRSVINQFAGGALRPQVFAYDPENPITNFGEAFSRNPSPFSSSYTDFIQSNPVGQITASQLGGIGEAVRSPEQLAQLGASMPGQDRKRVLANTSMPRPGGLDDEKVSRIMSRMVRAIF